MRNAELSGASARNGAKDAPFRDARADERFNLGDVPGKLIHNGAVLRCEVLDISLSGCSVRVLSPFTAGALQAVRTIFPIGKLVLNIWGVTQWVRGERLIGIRFLHPTRGSRNQLAALLTCLVDVSAAEAVTEAFGALAPGEMVSPILALEHPRPEVAAAVTDEAAEMAPEPVPEQVPEQEPEQVPELVPELVPEEEEFQEVYAEAPVEAERLTLSSCGQVLRLEKGEGPGFLRLVGDDSYLEGDVMDLGLDGCLMRLARPGAVRMNAQAEVDFDVRGLPFLLQAVTREMRDKETVELRFADLSRRKKQALEQVIDELNEAEQKRVSESAS